MHRTNSAFRLAASLALALFLGGEARADDTLTRIDGGTLSGQVTGVRDGQVQIKVGEGALALPLTQVKSVDMAAPAALAEAKDPATKPERVIAITTPLVAAYEGLPAPWVIEAMSLQGNAYAALDQLDKSNATFAELKKLYGESASTGASALPAKIGLARNALKQGHNDEAAALLQPVIEAARGTLAHSPAENAALGGAFLLYGRVLEAKGDAVGALNAYLTTTALFNRSEAAVAEAKTRADALRAAHPGLTIL